MNKIITALAILGLAFGAQAQTQTTVCGINSGKVCRPSSNKNMSCYKTDYAVNYKVCKNDFGYTVCCEQPNDNNSTHPKITPATENPVADNSVPETSYYYMVSKSYEGNYPDKKHHIKVCYTGDNVAEQNHNPYVGCPSPQYDGPDANRQRNVNVSNPEPMPPLAGQPY